MDIKKLLIYSAVLLFLVITSGVIITTLLKKSSQEQQNLYVINVLSEEQHDNCHIAGSIQLSLEKVEAFVKNLKKDTELVIYCSNYMCSGSGQTAKKLKKLGFTQVWAYEGGIAEWYQMGFPVKGLCTDAYLSKKMNKVEQGQAEEFEIITAQELYEKMKFHHLL